MRRELHKWYSSNLRKEMEVVVYGHYGYALLMFPTAGADYLEYERCQLIDSITDFINSGTLKVFCVNSINNESWLNRNMSSADKAIRHQQYNSYVVDEVIPFIKSNCSNSVPIVAAGASLGAFHAANTFFRNPALFQGFIAMSGMYSLGEYTNGYYDDNVYFNSPMDYLPNLNDENILKEMRNKSIILSCGQGAYEDPCASQAFSEVLHSKNISHWLDIWGNDIDHDWPSWQQMLPYFLENLNI